MAKKFIMPTARLKDMILNDQSVHNDWAAAGFEVDEDNYNSFLEELHGVEYAEDLAAFMALTHPGWSDGVIRGSQPRLKPPPKWYNRAIDPFRSDRLWMVVWRTLILAGIALLAARSLQGQGAAAAAVAAAQMAQLQGQIQRMRFVTARTPILQQPHDPIIIRVNDEGTALATRAAGLLTFDCVGAGIACTFASNTVTMTVAGGASTTQVQDTSLASCQDAGSTDAYACSLSPAPGAYTTGQVVWFKANTVNTGAATLNLNSLGAKTIKKFTAASPGADLADNDIRAGQWVQVEYDGTNFQMLSALGNAGGGSGSYTLMGTSVAASPADATTYYWGGVSRANFTTAGRLRLYIPKTGTITACYYYSNINGTLGSAETATLYIRLNNTTDTEVHTGIDFTTATNAFNNTSLSIAVTAGNYIEFKMLMPTWTTNPTDVIHTFIVQVDY